MSKFDSKKLLKSLTASKGAILTPHIDAYQRKGQFPDVWQVEIRNNKKSDDGFHPSGDCFTDPRTLYMEKMGLIKHEQISPTLRRAFDCGHMWHGYIQSMLIDMNFVQPGNVEKMLKQEIKTNRGICTGVGTADLVDVQIPGQGSWLVDIKTMNKRDFGLGASDSTLKKWQAQVSCYMDWLGADKAMILAVSKDSPHEFREYQIQKDQAMLNEIYDRWCYVKQCMRVKILPDGSYKPAF